MTHAVQNTRLEDLKRAKVKTPEKIDKAKLRAATDVKKPDVVAKINKGVDAPDRVSSPKVKTSIDKGYKDFSATLPDVATGTKIPGGVSSVNKGMHGQVPLEVQKNLNDINDGLLGEAKKNLAASTGDVYADPNKAAALKKQAEADVKRAGFKPLTEDGFFGKKSEQAVTKFQEDYNKRTTDKSKHLEVDGKVGQDTWRAMQAERARLNGDDGQAATTNDGHAHDRLTETDKAKAVAGDRLVPQKGDSKVAPGVVADKARIDAAKGPMAGDPAPGSDAYKAAQEAKYAMHGGLFGIGTDPAKLSKAIVGQSKDAASMNALKTAYKNKFGTDLPKDVAGDTSGRYNGYLQTLMKGERDTSGTVDKALVARQARDLRGAIHRNRSSKLNLTEVFAKSSNSHLRALESQFNATHPRSLQSELGRAAAGLSTDYYNALNATLDAARGPQAAKPVRTRQNLHQN